MKKLRTKKGEIKDSEGKTVQIEVTCFTGSYGIELFSKVALLLLPVAGAAKLKGDPKKSMLEKDIDFGDAAKILTTKLSEKKVVDIILEVVSATILIQDGESYDLSIKEVFDFAFAGEYGLLFQTLKFVLEANYSSFLAGSGFDINELLAIIK